jgi:hypothetical protein
LGPGASLVSSGGEYEWFITVRSEHMEELRQSIGVDPEVDILRFLQKNFAGTASYELEPHLRRSGIPTEFFCC